MVAKRISLEDAMQIPDCTISLFEDLPSGKVPIRKGQYYAIIADSQDRGVLISSRNIDSFQMPENDYLIGKLNDFNGSATMVFYGTE